LRCNSGTETRAGADTGATVSGFEGLGHKVLALYKFLATLASLSPQLTASDGRIVRRKSFFWIGSLALAGMVGLGVAPTEAAQGRKKTAAKTTTRRSAQPSLAKKATLARQRAVASQREMTETVVPRYKVDAAGELVPDLRAAAAIIFDPITGQVLWEENSQDTRSIASITKVMTATVFLENNPDTSQQVTVERSDVYQASTTHLRANDKVTVDDLLHLLLIASDNAAARALARVSPQGSAGFIVRMNEKASELGLKSTHYADPSGLLSDNVSSAYDMARLITNAAADERIGSIMRLKDYTVRTPRRTIAFHTTNRLLAQQEIDVRGAKTGFISKSGYCLATLLRLPQSSQEVAVVVLGARSNAGRFMETKNLFNWLESKASTLFATQTPALAVQQQ
jgi:serine-type D-Ala-D-Ala endopeptidase (penicillin-binding protein 7)